MSDTKLRDLERRWNETGTVEDEAAYLRERLRSGGLPITGVQIAAHCGHAAAVRVLECDDVTRSEPFDLDAWGRAFGRFDRTVCVRLSAALARELHQAWCDACPLEEDDPVRAVHQALRMWLSRPDEAEHLAADTLRRFGDEAMLYDLVCYTETGVETAACRAWEAAGCLISALQTSRCSVYPLEAAADICARAVTQLGDSQRVVRVVRSHLVPWALGRGDPLASLLPV